MLLCVSAIGNPRNFAAPPHMATYTLIPEWVPARLLLFPNLS